MKNGFRILDSDLHTMEPDDLWARYLDEPFRKVLPRFERQADGPSQQPTMIVGDLKIGAGTMLAQSTRAESRLQDRAFSRHPHYEDARARGYDPASYIEAMDIEGVDIGVLYGTRGRQILMHDDLEPAYAAALARAYNRWAHDLCRHDPERLRFAAQLAFHDVDLAVEEARRAVEEDGAVAVIGSPNPVNGRHIHDPAMEPLWETLAGLGVPLGIHPTGISSLRDDIGHRFWGVKNGAAMAYAAGNPMELMLAFASLAMGGVLERHPGLKVAFLEGTAGWLPWWLWRLDEYWESMGPGYDASISKLPSEYFRRQCYIATDPDEVGLHKVIESIGDERIVVSTDYPHSDGLFPEAMNEFLGLEKVSADSKRKILWDNCAGLYDLH
jgi:predicted TIM-barrel fold metal-dependent hydrolase